MPFNTHWLSLARLRVTRPAGVVNLVTLRRESNRSCVPEQPMALAEARIEGKIFGVLVTPL